MQLGHDLARNGLRFVTDFVLHRSCLLVGTQQEPSDNGSAYLRVRACSRPASTRPACTNAVPPGAHPLRLPERQRSAWSGGTAPSGSSGLA